MSAIRCSGHLISLRNEHRIYDNWFSATGYGLDGQGVGVRVPVGARFFFSPRHPDRFWGPHYVLSDEYWVLFPRG
jgi:hypothetical protein